MGVDTAARPARPSTSRASFAFLLTLLPATATIIGVIVLRQISSVADMFGVLLVMIGGAVHKPMPMPIATSDDVMS